MKGDTIPSAIEIIRDRDAGKDIFQLTDSPGALTHHLYFTSPTMTQDNESVIYGSDREVEGRFDLYKLEFGSFNSVQLTEAEGIWTQGAAFAPDGARCSSAGTTTTSGRWTWRPWRSGRCGTWRRPPRLAT